MRLQAKVLKTAAVTVFAIGLAALSGAHALSGASLRNSPEVAASIWPANGRAQEKTLYLSFVKQVREAFGPYGATKTKQSDRLEPDVPAGRLVGTADLRRFAAAAFPAPALALTHEPLLPKAHAILALSQSDPARRTRILELASRLNRRDLTLQGLVLQSKLDARDYDGTIDVLDQILRVNPERGAEFFPVLTTALRQEATTPAFRKLLARPLPWRDDFLIEAVRDPAAARNLAMIRQSTPIGKTEFNRALVASLVSSGDVDVAWTVYLQLTSLLPSGRDVRWASDFPPFDWTFADEAGMRAQPDRNGESLEFSVDPGRGGILASRLLLRPEAPFSIHARPQFDAASSAKDLKLTLACLGEAAPFLEATFADQQPSLDVRQLPGCDYLVLTLSGRAWTGSAPLNGSISAIRISHRQQNASEARRR